MQCCSENRAGTSAGARRKVPCARRSPRSASAARSIEKLVAAREAGFDGVEIFEPDLVASPRLARGDPGARRGARSVARSLPAVPRLRRRGPRPARAEPPTGGGEVHAHEPPRHRDHAAVQQRRDGAQRRRAARRRPAARAGGSRRAVRRARRLRGARVGSIRRQLRGRRAHRASRRSRPHRACAWTASTSCRRATTPKRSRRSPPTRSSSSSWRMRRSSPWTCSRGAGTTGSSPVRAASTSARSWAI